MSEIKHQNDSDVLAIVLHAFYIDVFINIIKSLKCTSVPFKLYVTTTHNHGVEVEDILEASGLSFYLLQVENRGRDVLPFFLIMPKVIQEGHDIILKLHTKKTSHRDDGNVWMGDILNKLVLDGNIGEYFGLIHADKSIGMVAPVEHILPISKYFGSNKRNVLDIYERLGFCEQDVKNEVFSAGTMFYARVSAMLPIINLGFTSEDFEEEKGQLDGTLAHAIERCFSISCFSAQLKLISTGGVSQPVQGDYTHAEARSFGRDASVFVKVFYYLLRPKKLLVKIKNVILH